MINSNEVVFIYKKYKKIKCLNYKDALENHDNLVKNCWKHIATLNLCSFLEYLYNEKSDEEMIDVVADGSQVY